MDGSVLVLRAWGAIKVLHNAMGGGKGVYDSAQISVQIRRCRTVGPM